MFFLKNKVSQKKNIDKNKYPPIFIQNFYKNFGKTISVNNISFSVKKGTIHGLIGPNGSGKTTTIKSLIGAYIPKAGKLLIYNLKAGSEKANKLIGYIPERASFPKHLNAKEYLKAMGQISGLKTKEANAKAISILKKLKLDKHAKRKLLFFSSGMQKKILLAQSLLSNPEILILDEPAANLDPNARKNLFNEIIRLRDNGKTILISSHILSELEKVIDDVTFLHYGNILYSGKVSNFIKSSSSLFIKTNNNQKMINYLKKNNIKYDGDLKNEVLIENISVKKAQNLFLQITKLKINIISFRMNDLQVAYSSLIKNKGNQK